MESMPWPLQAAVATKEVDGREDPAHGTAQVSTTEHCVPTTVPRFKASEMPTSKVAAGVTANDKHDISSPSSSAADDDADDESSGGDILSSLDYLYHRPHHDPHGDHISICITDLE
jgi:hypothetical protein